MIEQTRAAQVRPHAHDASHYLLIPESVAVPENTDEVAAVFASARARGTTVTFRSGGTSLSGQAVSKGLLVDTRKHFQQVTVLDDGARVRVQPGVTVGRVNAHLARYGRALGPDPASSAACTIGGVVANNSSGMMCGTEQNTYRTLDSAVLVLPSGLVLDTAAPDADALLRDREPELWRGLLELRDRIRGNPDSVATLTRLFALKNTMGYGLNSFLDHDDPVQILLHLVIGSEGTLAFVTEATFRTVPKHALCSTALLVFDSLHAANDALPELVGSGLAAIELLDAASLRVAAEDPKAPPLMRSMSVDQHAALLVEHQRDTDAELADAVAASEAVLGRIGLSRAADFSTDAAVRAGYWHVRKGLYAAVAGARPSGTTALLEDIAVPVPRLAETASALERLFDRFGYEQSVIFGHARDGNIHFLINERFEEPARVDAYAAFTEDMVDLVLGEGGTLKAEHGTGRIMAPFVRRQYGDELHACMERVKELVDPDGILNPDVVLTRDDRLHLRDIKHSPTVESEVDRCVECGYCEPVCPSRDLTLTPRQRIVARREIATAEEAGDDALAAELREAYAYDGIETCAVDGMCVTACPVGINTGDLVRRLRAEEAPPLAQRAGHVAARAWGPVTTGASLALTVADHLPAPLVTGVTDLARRVAGTEVVPRWTSDLPAGGRRRGRRSDPRARAVFLPSCTSTMFGPGATDSRGASRALLSVCDRAGVPIRVPDASAGLCCGTPWKSKGLTTGWAAMRDRLLPVLWEASDQGRLPIIVDASSCTEGVAVMLESASAPYDGLRVVDAIEFVAAEVIGRVNVSSRLDSVMLHPTCATTQLGSTDAMRQIAEAFADEVHVPTAWGCCAFAGDRGMLHPELTASATAAEAAEVRSVGASAHASANRTCEIGMTRATGQEYVHVLELLERATR